MDRDTRTTIAVREAKEFYQSQLWRTAFNQVFMLVVLGVLAYEEVAIRWIVMYGIFAGVGTICGLINQLSRRLDAGRAYMEIWATDMEDAIESIQNRMT